MKLIRFNLKCCSATCWKCCVTILRNMCCPVHWTFHISSLLQTLCIKKAAVNHFELKFYKLASLMESFCIFAIFKVGTPVNFPEICSFIAQHIKVMLHPCYLLTVRRSKNVHVSIGKCVYPMWKLKLSRPFIQTCWFDGNKSWFN